jgi:hypothetical protein
MKKQKNSVWLVIVLILISSNLAFTQKVKVYSIPFNQTFRYYTNDKQTVIDGYYKLSIKSKDFFMRVHEICLSQTEIVDSIILKESEKYKFDCRLIFKDKKNELIFYGSKYYTFNSKTYQVNCEIYSYFIQYFTVKDAALLVSPLIFDCELPNSLFLHYKKNYSRIL